MNDPFSRLNTFNLACPKNFIFEFCFGVFVVVSVLYFDQKPSHLGRHLLLIFEDEKKVL